MLYIRPVGGLCNCLRAIASIFALAEEYGQKVTVFWLVNSEIKCEFEKNFMYK